LQHPVMRSSSTNAINSFNMKTLTLLATALISVACVHSQNVDIVPKPVSVEYHPGQIRSNNINTISYTDSQLSKECTLFSAEAPQLIGHEMEVSAGTDGDIVLSLETTLDSEEYILNIKGRKILISGGSPAGVFYGLQTLKQLLVNENIPRVKIKDKPHFAYRGTHLDVARHFYTVEQVKTYIDILALHKINKFHWHLTDDQGWRIEIKKYPRLTTVGSIRKETIIGRHTPDNHNYDGKPHGGFYTQEEIRDIVAYAADRHIEVIPEIDLPGHMQAALAAYPELGCTGGPYELWCTWGISKDVLCAGNDKIYGFLEDILSEVCELFPSPYIHIGGDECPKDRWEECPKCQAKIKALGLKDKRGHKAEHYLQNHIMNHMEKFLEGKGRKIIGWDEILEGSASKTATIMVWRDEQHGVDATRRGNNVIFTIRHYCYFDYCQTSDPYNEPLCNARRYLPMKQAYRLDPYDRIMLQYKDKVLGVQANLWTEFISDFGHLQHALLPRLAALSETAWAYDRKDTYDVFAERAKNILPGLYNTYNYNYAPYFFEDIE